MTFWSNITPIEPLRKYRFLGSLENNNIRIDLKSISLPSFETDTTEHRLLNHNVKFPSIGRWTDVTMSFVVTEDFLQKNFLSLTRYRDIRNTSSQTLFKRQRVGKPRVQIFDSSGAVITTWTFHNAFIPH